jgi:hypothetical protein
MRQTPAAQAHFGTVFPPERWRLVRDRFQIRQPAQPGGQGADRGADGGKEDKPAAREKEAKPAKEKPEAKPAKKADKPAKAGAKPKATGA